MLQLWQSCSAPGQVRLLRQASLCPQQAAELHQLALKAWRRLQLPRLGLQRAGCVRHMGQQMHIEEIYGSARWARAKCSNFVAVHGIAWQLSARQHHLHWQQLAQLQL